MVLFEKNLQNLRQVNTHQHNFVIQVLFRASLFLYTMSTVFEIFFAKLLNLFLEVVPPIFYCYSQHIKHILGMYIKIAYSHNSTVLSLGHLYSTTLHITWTSDGKTYAFYYPQVHMLHVLFCHFLHFVDWTKESYEITLVLIMDDKTV